MTIAVFMTDLSAAFDTVDTEILENKLEHLRIRGKELAIISTYLEDRWAFVEVQGYHSTVKLQPKCSVIQGSELSSTFYTIYTLDLTERNQNMNDNDKFKSIVGRELTNNDNKEQESTGYLDNVTHILAARNK